MVSFNLSFYVQSPPVLEYRPRTDVRILKAMFEYFILESNKFKQKSFQYNQINSLSKVRITKPRQEHSTFATLWVPPYFLFPWHFLLIIKITFVKTPDNSLFSDWWKNREKRGSWFSPLNSGGWNYIREIKNWIQILDLVIIGEELGLSIFWSGNLILETDSRGGNLHSLIRFTIRRHDNWVKRNMATTTGN